MHVSSGRSERPVGIGFHGARGQPRMSFPPWFGRQMIWRALCPRRSILSRASGWSRAPTVLLILPVRDGIGPSLLVDASFGLGRVLVPWIAPRRRRLGSGVAVIT